MVELQHYFAEPRDNQRVLAVPGQGTHVPLWILGSSLYGAGLAAMLGLPYAFASHFAPAYLDAAIEMYREKFEPSEQLEKPYVMLGFNVCAAETEDEAKLLRTSSLQSFVRLRQGNPGQLPPPVAGFEESLSAMERQTVAEIVRCSAVGTPAQVGEAMGSFIERTGADELMLVSSIFDHEKRVRSLEITAEVGAQFN